MSLRYSALLRIGDGCRGLLGQPRRLGDHGIGELFAHQICLGLFGVNDGGCDRPQGNAGLIHPVAIPKREDDGAVDQRDGLGAAQAKLDVYAALVGAQGLKRNAGQHFIFGQHGFAHAGVKLADGNRA